MVIPIATVMVLITGYGTDEAALLTGGALFLPTVLMILFRRKYPRWWFDWNLEVTRFTTRVWAYLGLLRDEYPSTDEEQAVHLDLDYPDASRDLNRWLPIVKWIFATPPYIVLTILGIGAILSVVIAWFAILITGRYPRRLFNFVVCVDRWWLRVVAYMWLLITDRYPPFSLKQHQSARHAPATWLDGSSRLHGGRNVVIDSQRGACSASVWVAAL